MNVQASISLGSSQSAWLGFPSAALGIVLYFAMNTSYSIAVFTDPGSPLSRSSAGNGGHQYSPLPIAELPEFTAYTVNSAGGARYCRKCQCPKPDRTHHCSTCKRCVLKMDHHCPWLATCVGFYNYKAFLLFLIYTSLFCWVCFGTAALWIWAEISGGMQFMDHFLPVNVILLTIIGGVLGLVLTGFTAWHINLACRGITTLECLEKTRYASPLRKALDRHRNGRQPPGDNNAGGEPRNGLIQRLQDYGNQIIDAHANTIPGVTRVEEGEERLSPPPDQSYPGGIQAVAPCHDNAEGSGPGPTGFSLAQQSLQRSYVELERQRERDRYREYQDEADNEKLPHAFDLGWRRNLLHLFGPQPLLWPIPVCTITGDGWRWEVSPKFLEARERLRQTREQELADERQYYRDLYQRNMDNGRSWIGGNRDAPLPTWVPGRPVDAAYNHDRPASGVSLMTLRPMSPRPRPGDSDYEDSVDDDSRKITERGSSPDLEDLRRSSATDDVRVNNGNRLATSSQGEADEWRDWE